MTDATPDPMYDAATEAAVAAAEARVRALRDETRRVAERLEGGGTIRIAEVLERLRGACDAVEGDDLGADAATIRAQFEALFERLDGLLERHPEPVPADALGLPVDARFLTDMAVYLTRRFGLEDDDQ